MAGLLATIFIVNNWLVASFLRHVDAVSKTFLLTYYVQLNEMTSN